MNHSAWLGLDIGGANLKAADGRGYAESRKFPLWKRPEDLAAELRNLLQSAPPADRLAITMTGELADCFENKSEGVHHILDCVEHAAGAREVAVYLVSGKLVTPSAARRNAYLTAASNWHALASFCCRFLRQSPQPATPGVGPQPGSETGPPRGLLIDVGSTTTDIVPISSEIPLSSSRTDTERLQRGELVYTGVRRSPVCAVVSELPSPGGRCPVAQEVFATTADAYVLLGALPEDPQDVGTADGRPLTASAAHARLARMVCADTSSYSYNGALDAAAAVRDAQIQSLRRALTKVISRMPSAPDNIVLSGEGEFLARAALVSLLGQVRTLSLAGELGEDASKAAPAHAVAVLAAERREVGQ